MIIDFHTHVFPDELAPRAMAGLMSVVEGLYTPANDGTVKGLVDNMDAWGIDASVVMPVITKASQVRKTNEWVKSLCSDRIIAFGGIYPHGDTWKEDIDFVCGLGLKGLKFHAEYQDFILDSPEMLKIYDYALARGLILLHHGGFDPAYPPPFRSSPRMFKNVADAMRGGVIVAAHFGGHDQWDDVEKYLVGTGIYLDTSMGFPFFGDERFLRVAERHGTDKILFASDAPWSDARAEIARLKSLPLTPEEIDAILGGNARRILGL
ncbi:MAG: amidohydrolase family protein [Oscillospiraceae bacterium]|jgi:predicted TIM-barrel fold metal-dependent hydrolase|nr:amidohydrolase family protein [Oscillospiraceae bacterium]